MAKHLPQQGGREGSLGTPVPCGKGGAVPEMIGAVPEIGTELGALEVMEMELVDVDSDEEEDDDVLGAGAALPVLPKQNDCTQRKYARVLSASQPDLIQLETADPG